MHDFRVVGDSEDRTLIFDVVINKKYNSEHKKELIANEIQQHIKDISPKYRSIVTLDVEFY